MRSLLSPALAALAFLVVSCQEAENPPPRREPAEVRLPDLSSAEPQVTAKLEDSAAAVREQPGSAARWGSLGMDLQAHLFYVEAAACYEQAAALDRSDYRWPYLAAVSLMTSSPPDALDWFARAEKLRPATASFHVSYGSALLDQGNVEGARDQFRKALVIEEAPQALLGLGRAAFREGDAEEALVHLERAVTIAPWLNAAHELRAQAYRRLGDEQRSELAALAARAYPEEAALPDPVLLDVVSRGVSSRALSERGLRLERDGKLEEAEAALRKVLDLHAPNARDYSNLGGVLARMGRLDDAIAAYQKGLGINPDEAFAHNNLGLALLAKGDLSGAEEHFQKAIASDGALADALYNLATLRMRQQRPAEARELLNRALAANPAHRESLTRLGTLLVTGGEIEEGTALWRRAVAIDPYNIDARYNLAIVLAREGDHASAIEHLEAALAQAPNSSILLRLLAWELATAPDQGLRDGRRAVEMASRVRAGLPDEPRVSDILAAGLAEQGRWEEAVAAAGEAVRLARARGDRALAAEIGTRLASYEARRPHRQPVRTR